MILENIMEEKQLDFNQPLLSVRRFSSTVASDTDNKKKSANSLARRPPLPAYKSELKSGPVRNAGTVPFVWEQTPGRPKDENKLQTQVVECPPITPNLPPGRVLKVKQKDSGKVSKATLVTQSRRGSAMSNSQTVKSMDKNETKHESPKEAMQEKASSVSDDGDEAYLDALDTLSRTESFFMNCSVSGLSGLNDQEVQLSRSLSTDQRARDFMIDRFLPAAQAIASETPQYASRKPPIAREQLRQVRKVMGGERCRPLNQHRPKVSPPYAQDVGWEESEDEDDIYNGSENYAAKVCGLFPGFCLLNPIPGLRMQDKVLSSSVYGVQAKSSASHSETGIEHARTAYYEKKSADSQSGFTQEKYFLGIPEKSKDVIDQHGRGCSTLSPFESTQCESGCSSPVIEKTLYVDSVHKVKSHSSLNSSETKVRTNPKRDDSESFRKDRIYKNPSRDPLLENSKLLGIADEKATLQPKGLGSLDSSLLSSSDFSINDMQMEMTEHFNKACPEKQELVKSGSQERELDKNFVVISSPKVAECKKIDSAGNQESFDGGIHTSVSCRKFKLAGDLEVDLKRQQATESVDQECSHGLKQNPSTLASPNVVGDGKIDLENRSLMKSSNQENSDTRHLQLPLALPLPKAPSESWLKRTLPTISSRNIYSRSYPAAQIHARGQSPKTALLGPKWETIVKSSNLHNGHLRFSEELLAPIPET